jgi:hypothetical protein
MIDLDAFEGCVADHLVTGHDIQQPERRFFFSGEFTGVSVEEFPDHRADGLVLRMSRGLAQSV